MSSLDFFARPRGRKRPRTTTVDLFRSGPEPVHAVHAKEAEEDEGGGVAVFAARPSAAPPVDASSVAAAALAERRAGVRALLRLAGVQRAGAMVDLDTAWTTWEDMPPTPSVANPPADDQQLAAHARARAALLTAVEASMYKEPTGVQMAACGALAAGRDVLACAPTGSGKTAAFALPLLLRLQRRALRESPRALILAPTRELVAQTVRELDRLGGRALGIVSAALTREAAAGAAGGRVSAAVYASGLQKNKKQRGRRNRGRTAAATDAAGEEAVVGEGDAGGEGGDDVLHWTDDEDLEVDLGMKRGGSSEAAAAAAPAAGGSGAPPQLVVPHLPRCDILVTTPLQLVAVLHHAEREAAAGDAGNEVVRFAAVIPHLQCLVLDEVDRLLELNFVEQVDAILAAMPTTNVRGGRHRVQCAMFTATLPSGIEDLSLSCLSDPVRVLVGVRGAAATTVSQRLLFVGREEGKVLALRQMLASGLKPPVLIFVQSKERVEPLARVLALEGVKVGVIHADRTPAQRDAAVTAFRRGDTPFLVATDVLARGVDFRAVNVVVNYDFPQSAIAYVHRIGRTGRAGRSGEAVTFFTEEDITLLRAIANVMRVSGCDVQEWMLSLKKIRNVEKRRRERAPPQRARVKA